MLARAGHRFVDSSWCGPLRHSSVRPSSRERPFLMATTPLARAPAPQLRHPRPPLERAHAALLGGADDEVCRSVQPPVAFPFVECVSRRESQHFVARVRGYAGTRVRGYGSARVRAVIVRESPLRSMSSIRHRVRGCGFRVSRSRRAVTMRGAAHYVGGMRASQCRFHFPAAVSRSSQCPTARGSSANGEC